MGKTAFDQTLRVLTCESCGAPVTGAVTGGRARCDYCNAINMLPARDDRADKEAASHSPTMSEGERFQRLRSGDGQSLEPPTSLKRFVRDGALAPEVEDEAVQAWKAACAEVEKGASFGASERLFYLTVLLYGLWSTKDDDLGIRALIETGLQHLGDPAFRSQLHGMLSRNAARLDDVDAAAYWLSLCDANSANLHVDTSYRFSAAYLATVQQDFDRVILLLGSHIDDVPIADSNDFVCGVLRANAMEQTGHLDEAVNQLTRWLTVSKQSVQAIVEANAGLDLCPRSMPAADDFTGGLDGEVLKTKSMFDFRGMFGRLMLSTIALPVFLGVGFVFFDENMVFAIPFVFLIFFGSTFYFVFRLATRPARLRRYLEANGVKGSATILSVESTSVRVNRRPMINLKLK
ncbi:MAG: hypothetical protein ACPG4T_15415, partial [Nannocystaceae bacterium]